MLTSWVTKSTTNSSRRATSSLKNWSRYADPLRKSRKYLRNRANTLWASLVISLVLPKTVKRPAYKSTRKRWIRCYVVNAGRIAETTWLATLSHLIAVGGRCAKNKNIPSSAESLKTQSWKKTPWKTLIDCLGLMLFTGSVLVLKHRLEDATVVFFLVIHLNIPDIVARFLEHVCRIEHDLALFVFWLLDHQLLRSLRLLTFISSFWLFLRFGLLLQRWKRDFVLCPFLSLKFFNSCQRISCSDSITFDLGSHLRGVLG